MLNTRIEYSKGEKYVPPPQSLDSTCVTKSELSEILEKSEKKLAATLASELNLGGKLQRNCGIIKFRLKLRGKSQCR